MVFLRACLSFKSTTAGGSLCLVRRKLRRAVILHQQFTTQAGAKIVPALRVVAEKALTLAAFAADYCDMGHRFPFSSHSYSDELAN